MEKESCKVVWQKGAVRVRRLPYVPDYQIDNFFCVKSIEIWCFYCTVRYCAIACCLCCHDCRIEMAVIAHELSHSTTQLCLHLLTSFLIHLLTHAPFDELVPHRSAQSINWLADKHKRTHKYIQVSTWTPTHLHGLYFLWCNQCVWGVLTKMTVRKVMTSFCAMDATPKHT